SRRRCRGDCGAGRALAAPWNAEVSQVARWNGAADGWSRQQDKIPATVVLWTDAVDLATPTRENSTLAIGSAGEIQLALGERGRAVCDDALLRSRGRF